MRTVAERAGVALGTLYRYFPSKMDLVVAVVAEEIDLLETSIQRRPPRAAAPARRAVDVLMRATRGLMREPELADALVRSLIMSSVQTDFGDRITDLLLRVSSQGDGPAARRALEWSLCNSLANVWVAELLEILKGTAHGGPGAAVARTHRRPVAARLLTPLIPAAGPGGRFRGSRFRLTTDRPLHDFRPRRFPRRAPGAGSGAEVPRSRFRAVSVTPLGSPVPAYQRGGATPPRKWRHRASSRPGARAPRAGPASSADATSSVRVGVVRRLRHSNTAPRAALQAIRSYRPLRGRADRTAGLASCRRRARQRCPASRLAAFSPSTCLPGTPSGCGLASRARMTRSPIRRPIRATS